MGLIPTHALLLLLARHKGVHVCNGRAEGSGQGSVGVVHVQVSSHLRSGHKEPDGSVRNDWLQQCVSLAVVHAALLGSDSDGLVQQHAPHQVHAHRGLAQLNIGCDESQEVPLAATGCVETVPFHAHGHRRH